MILSSPPLSHPFPDAYSHPLAPFPCPSVLISRRFTVVLTFRHHFAYVLALALLNPGNPVRELAELTDPVLIPSTSILSKLSLKDGSDCHLYLRSPRLS